MSGIGPRRCQRHKWSGNPWAQRRSGLSAQHTRLKDGQTRYVAHADNQFYICWIGIPDSHAAASATAGVSLGTPRHEDSRRGTEAQATCKLEAGESANLRGAHSIARREAPRPPFASTGRASTTVKLVIVFLRPDGWDRCAVLRSAELRVEEELICRRRRTVGVSGCQSS